MPSRTYIGRLLAGCSLLLLGCASERLEPGPGCSHSESYALPLDEAAALVAELAARELDQFRRDRVTPLCRAEREGAQAYRIYYQSGDGGGFEPYADVELRRERFLGAGSTPLLAELPGSPLGRVTEHELPRRVAPGNGAVFRIDARLRALGPERSELALHCEGSVLGTAADRVQRWSAALRFAAELRAAHAQLRGGDVAGARAALHTVRERHRRSRGTLEQELMALTWALLARIEADARRWHEAQRACAHALLLAPEAAELHRLRATIAVRLGDRRQLARSEWRTQAFAAPGRGTPAPGLPQSGGWRESCLAAAERALGHSDPVSARAWAQRALDERPDDAAALVLLARCAAYEGDHRQARDLLLTCLQRHGSSESLVLQLVAMERCMGSRRTALHLLLHHSAAHPRLLHSAHAFELAREMSPLALARVFRAEGLTHDALHWLALWSHTESEPRAAELVRYFAPDRRVHELLRTGLGGERWTAEHGPGLETGPEAVPAAPPK